MSMKTLLVANPKGGSSKTTLATNLAGYLATRGRRVSLLDMDRQRSASGWLEARDATLPPIDSQHSARHTQKSDWLVIDSPAGLHGRMLEHTLGLAQRVIVPIGPSSFDMAASRDFLTALAAERAVRRGRIFVGVVGMRIDPRTSAAVVLQEFLQSLDLPVLAYLRDAQVYVNAAFEGRSLFDLPPHIASRELEQWEYMTDWLNREDQK